MAVAELWSLDDENIMEIGDTKPLKKAAVAFCIVFAVVFVVDFGSYYLGLYGFSFAPFAGGKDSLWPIIHSAAMIATVAGFPAAGAVYGGGKKKHESKSNEVV